MGFIQQAVAHAANAAKVVMVSRDVKKQQGEHRAPKTGGKNVKTKFEKKTTGALSQAKPSTTPWWVQCDAAAVAPAAAAPAGGFWHPPGPKSMACVGNIWQDLQ